MSDDFYRAFEDKFRGPREDIKAKLQVYLPFITILNKWYPKNAAVDLGCGRGEWLELMRDHGIEAIGVDLDEDMLRACRERNLTVTNQDAISHIKTLKSDSVIAVTAFHLVEHIPFEQLKLLVSESLRVLKPGGLLIMETPNPENIIVATNNFYFDPTHIRPIPSMLLEFLPVYYGFEKTKLIRLNTSKELEHLSSLSIYHVLIGVSHDYAVVAQKKAVGEEMNQFESLYSEQFGVGLETLSSRYDQKFNSAEVRLTQIEKFAQELSAKVQQAEIKVQQAEIKVTQAEQALVKIYNSRSWRWTAPLRGMNKFLRKFK